MKAHAFLERGESPRQLASHVGVELDREPAAGVNLAVDDLVGFQHIVDSRDLADFLVERHQREAETEHRARHDHELAHHHEVGVGLAACHHSQCRTMTPMKKASAMAARISAVLSLPLTAIPIALVTDHLTKGGVSNV
ncbi:hypothetical protein D3C83_19020 [compost metagenome]